MASDQGRAGFHVSKGDFKTYAAALGGYMDKFTPNFKFKLNAQIFAAGPKTWHLNVKPADAREIAQRLSKKMDIYIHSTYLSNLWSDNKPVRHKTIEMIRDELEIGRQMGAKGVVIHFRDWEPDKLVPALRVLGNPEDITLYLEIASKRALPNCYSNPAWISGIFQQLKSFNVGLCIDTAHAWATGVDLTKESVVKEYFAQINTHGKPILIHCNDNVYGCGALKDEHINIGEGEIWGEHVGYKAVFALGYPIIFERGGDIDNDADLYLYNNYYKSHLETDNK